jgi:hypothetical protein
MKTSNYMPGFAADASLYATKRSYWLAPSRAGAGEGRVVSQLPVGVNTRQNPCYNPCKCCIHTHDPKCCGYCDDCLEMPIPGRAGIFLGAA